MVDEKTNEENFAAGDTELTENVDAQPVSATEPEVIVERMSSIDFDDNLYVEDFTPGDFESEEDADSGPFLTPGDADHEANDDPNEDPIAVPNDLRKSKRKKTIAEKIFRYYHDHRSENVAARKE